jgi:CRP/FNR family cyclic AMP-dependent transcriptional regulator
LEAKRLRDVPLFARLSRHDLDEVAHCADEVDAREGEVLARQGDIGHEFFVIESGRAEVTKDGERIAEMGPGDFFGEIALISEERRTATVTALEPMTCVVMTGKTFRGLKRSQPEVYETVRAEVARRMALHA